jgi:hypothetical protein
MGTDMAVFRSAQHAAAWAGIYPGNNESAGKRKRAGARQDTGRKAHERLEQLPRGGISGSRTRSAYRPMSVADTNRVSDALRVPCKGRWFLTARPDGPTVSNHMSDRGVYSIPPIDRMWPLAAASHDGQRRSGVHAVAVWLLSGFTLLAPLACASPLDAGWTDGLYDNGDYDEIKRVLNISALSDVDGATDTSSDWKLSPPIRRPE